ncbi:MAG: hypothetical protein HY720_29430 [Planctomycetes bacterium]|nr:hypothetical protein [Planctomycetota bacterium]
MKRPTLKDATRLLSARRALGLFVTDRWAAAVEVLVRAEGLKVERFLAIDLPAGSSPAEKIRSGLSAAGVEARRVHLVLPVEHGILRELELPPGEPEEIERMVRLQVEKDLPFPLEKGRLAFVAAQRGRGIRVHAAVVRSEVFDRHAELVAEAGLELAGMTLSPLAVSVLVSGLGQPPNSPGANAALVAEGNRLQIQIEDPEGYLLARSIPFGDQHLESGVLPWPDAFRREFTRTVNAYRSRHPGAAGPRVHIAAPEAQYEALAAAARAAGAEEVRPLSPAAARGVFLSAGVPEGKFDPVFAAPVGALLAAECFPKAGLDFVSSGAPRRLWRFKPGRGRLVAGAAAVLALLAVPYALKVHRAGEAQELAEQVDAIREERKRLKPEVARVDSLSPWGHERFPWIDVQRDLATLVDNRETVLASVSRKGAGSMQISGRARSVEAAESLARRMNDSGRYEAKLGSTGSAGNAAGELRNFPVRFDLAVSILSARRVQLVTPLPEGSP